MTIGAQPAWFGRSVPYPSGFEPKTDEEILSDMHAALPNCRCVMCEPVKPRPRLHMQYGRWWADIIHNGKTKVAVAGATPQQAYEFLAFHCRTSYPEYFR